MKYLITILVVLFFQNLFSQNVQKGFEYLNSKKYDKAIEIFRSSIKKKKDKVASKYGMSKVYFCTDYSKYSYLNAYRNIKSACSYLEKASDSDKKELLKKHQLTSDSLLRLKTTIIDTAIAIAKRKNTVEAYNNFIINFKDEKKKARELSRIRNEIAYDKTKKIGTYKAFGSYIRKYPKSQHITEAKKTYTTLSNEFYRYFTQDGELRTFIDFEKLYPYFDYPVGKREYDKRWAKKGGNIGLTIAFRNEKLDYNDIMLKVIDFKDFISHAAPSERAFVAVQRLMEPAIREKNWDAAIDTLDNYASYFGENDKRIKTLYSILKKEEDIKIKSISDLINTDKHEYAPVMSADGKTLYFCGKKRPDNIGVEDIFVSKFVDSLWQKPVPVPGINTVSGNEAPLSVSADGNEIFYFSNSNIYSSKKTKTGWSKKIPTRQLNTESEWEADAMLTSDAKAILFVSDRPGSVGHYRKINDLYHGTYNGNTDIYVIEKTEYGWSAPINLGDAINTFYCDRCPFLHPDMKTLYFSSEGHGGLGRLDIFKTTRLNDTSWTEWSEPVHLGKEVNTAGDDWGYRITTDGKYAYFASTENKNYNISIFELPIHFRPEMVATISGKVDTKFPLPENSKIVWEDLKTGKHEGEAVINPLDNSFFITLPLGKKYGFHIDAKGFFPVSQNIDLLDKKHKIELKETFSGISIKEILDGNKGVRLNNLFFDHDKYEIKPESFAELNRIARFIINNGFQSVEIGGHTDNTGNAQYNKKLSENRANSIKLYLTEKGCDTEIFIVKGYGQEKPITDNNTEEGKTQNRRVEIKILDKE